MGVPLPGTCRRPGESVAERAFGPIFVRIPVAYGMTIRPEWAEKRARYGVTPNRALLMPAGFQGTVRPSGTGQVPCSPMQRIHTRMQQPGHPQPPREDMDGSEDQERIRGGAAERDTGILRSCGGAVCSRA